MTRCLFGVLFLLVPCLLVGCGGGMEKFPTADAKGQVLCNGKPVPNVMIFFEPTGGGGSAIVGKPGFAEANENGEFVLTTYSDGDGAVVGKHNVKVDRPSSEDFPNFSCDCQLSDVDVAKVVEVVDGGENDFKIELPQKKKTRGRKKQDLSDEELEEMEDE